MIEDLYQEALDRKNNPKADSYTNYLYDHGLDKILKKVGEEATEVVIAAKNGKKEEIVLETADLLYHLSVMLIQTNTTLEELQTELDGRVGKRSRLHDRPEIKNY
jgi:phosphoribosyl-ATP pyrophosphohydrolase